jgi:hypothetical protein
MASRGSTYRRVRSRKFSILDTPFSSWKHLVPPSSPFAGQCEKEIEKYCKDEDEGNGQLATCISDAIAQSELPGDGGFPPKTPVPSFACTHAHTHAVQCSAPVPCPVNAHLQRGLACMYFPRKVKSKDQPSRAQMMSLKSRMLAARRCTSIPSKRPAT